MQKILIRTVLLLLAAGVIFVIISFIPAFFSAPYRSPYKLAGIFLLIILISHIFASIASAYIDA